MQVVRATLRVGTCVEAVEVRERARTEALHDAVIVIEGTAAVDRITQTVVERADAGAVQLALRGLREQRVVRDLTEVPALAVDVESRSVHAVLLEGELREGLLGTLHLFGRVVTHQVEAEAVDVVVLRPVNHRVDHEAFTHDILGSNVRTTRRCLDFTGGAQALIVARNDAVEHRVSILACSRRVVVNLVEDDLHTDVVQTADHGTELTDTRTAILVPHGRVRSLGGHPVQRVIPPVVGVLISHRGHRRLLRLIRGTSVLRDRRDQLLGALLRNRRNIEGRQEVHRIHARRCQLRQVAHAVGLVLRKRHVGAAHVLGDRLVGRREVTHVQLVDGALCVVLDDGGLGALPTVGGDCGVIHVDGNRARRIRGQAHRVGVGHLISLHGTGGGHVDAHLPQVLGPFGDGAVGIVDAPASVVGARRRGPHGRARHLGVSAPRSTRVPRQQGHVLGGGGPQGEGRLARVVPSHAVRGLGGLGRVDGVERRGDLHTREGIHSLTGLLREHHLSGERLARPGLVEGGLQGDIAVEVRVSHRDVRGQVAGDGQRREGRSGDSTVRQSGTPLGRGDQLVTQLRGAVKNLGTRDSLGQQQGRPRQGCGIDPVSALLADADNGNVSGGDVQLVGRGIVGECHELVRLRRKLVVSTTGGTILPVVLIPRAADSNLQLVRALRQCPRLVGVGAPAHRLHERGQAFRLPVVGATQVLLEGTRKRHHLVGDVIPHAVSRVVVVEGDRSLFLQRVGDVRSPGCSPLAVGGIPRAALGDLVLVVTRGQGESRGVDARRVARQGGLSAVGSPVGVAPHRLIMVTRDCHQEVVATGRTLRVDGLRTRVLICCLLPWLSPGCRERAPHQRKRSAYAQGSTQQRPVVSVCHERLPRPKRSPLRGLVTRLDTV